MSSEKLLWSKHTSEGFTVYIKQTVNAAVYINGSFLITFAATKFPFNCWTICQFHYYTSVTLNMSPSCTTMHSLAVSCRSSKNSSDFMHLKSLLPCSTSQNTFSLMNSQMIRVISSPSISTTGFATLMRLSASVKKKKLTQQIILISFR